MKSEQDHVERELNKYLNRIDKEDIRFLFAEVYLEGYKHGKNNYQKDVRRSK